MIRTIGFAALAMSAIGTATLVTALPATAETFRWSATTDPQTMDPHAANLAPVTSFLNNIYEGLVRRGRTMEIEPSLATTWEPLEDEPGWRFHLREGVPSTTARLSRPTTSPSPTSGRSRSSRTCARGSRR
jgi:ABC-type transport system substrate-binding protein